MLHRKGFFDCATLEGDNRIGLEGKPSFLVAIDCGHVASGLEGISRRRTSASEQAKILVLCVDSADGAILLFKSDGEEFAFGGADQVTDFFVHFVSMFGLFVGKKVAAEGADGKKNCRKNEGQGDQDCDFVLADFHD